ncbi:MAG TPA: response regulator [Ktedonobacterales bacterium]
MGKVLVVDDDPSIRDMLRDVLTEEGHDVVLARDGVEALEVLQREGRFLVLLDLMMPRLDGLGVLRVIEKHPSMREQTRVIIMSAAERLFALSSVLHGGMVSEQIAKPFELDQMLDLVNRFAPDGALH